MTSILIEGAGTGVDVMSGNKLILPENSGSPLEYSIYLPNRRSSAYIFAPMLISKRLDIFAGNEQSKTVPIAQKPLYLNVFAGLALGLIATSLVLLFFYPLTAVAFAALGFIGIAVIGEKNDLWRSRHASGSTVSD